MDYDEISPQRADDMSLELTSEPLEVISWSRRRNSTPQFLDGKRYGRLSSWIRRPLDSLRVWFDTNEGERTQDIKSYNGGRRGRLWLGGEGEDAGRALSPAKSPSR